MTLVVGGLVAAVVVGIAVLVARDMDRRGRNGELYAVAVLFVLPLGVLMWALDRRRPAVTAPPSSDDPKTDAVPDPSPPA